MKKEHALIDYTNFKDNDLIAEGFKVVSHSTGNPHAANAVPTVAQVNTATEEFQSANTLAAGGDHQLVILKGKKRTTLETTMGEFADCIDKVADGDIEIIEGCGLRSSKQPIQGLHEDLELKHGQNPGEIIAKCKKWELAGSYVWQYYYGLTPPTDDELWKWKKVSLQLETTMSGFNRGDILIRYCAVLREGMQPWSQHRHIFVI